MKNKVVELALNLDPLLIRYLLQSESMKSHFSPKWKNSGV